ncbi:MAG TPA: protein kinase, partial [Polyangiaceae bacterium]|nr:protein kinase [Polyangiaceae bacterium]
LVMELLDGESLEERLAVARRLSLDETAVVVEQAAGVLDKAHLMGIVHRDIKPGNLFLTSAGSSLFVKILDFGIAKQHGAHGPNALSTSSGAVLGTPGYMSPEQLLEARGADASADQWALAVVAYEMITGALPFEGETFAAVNLAICTAKIRPASSWLPELPAAVDAFFAKAFHIDRKQRFATAAELARAFREACGGTALTAPALPARSQPSLASGDTALASSVVGPQSVMSSTTTVRDERGPKRRWRIAAIATAGAVLAASAIWSGRRALFRPDKPSTVDAAPVKWIPPRPAASPKPTVAPSIAIRPKALPKSPARTPKPDCSDPFFIDKKGIKRVRRECL